MSDPTLLQRVGSSDNSLRAYVVWVAKATDFEITEACDDYIKIEHRPAEDSIEQTRKITFDGSIDSIRQIWELQRDSVTGSVEAEPVGEPSKVASLAGPILQPYQVREGRVQLAGCVFDPRPFLRITVADPDSSDVRDHWFNQDGTIVDKTLLNSLNLEQIACIEPRLRKSDRTTVDTWVDAASDSIDMAYRLGVTVVWCRWVHGTVSVQFDNGSQAKIGFEGWAVDWANGSQVSPKYKCTSSEIESYNIVSLEDGTITVAEAVGTCSLTGAEVLLSNLAKCAVSGQAVLREKLTTCPISEDRFLPEFGHTCDWCQLSVATSVISDGKCSRCSDLEEIRSDHVSVRQLCQQIPEYSRIRSWRGWSNQERTVLVGKNWLSETLIVMDARKNVINKAIRRRFSSLWQFAPQRKE